MQPDLSFAARLRVPRSVHQLYNLPRLHKCHACAGSHGECSNVREHDSERPFPYVRSVESRGSLTPAHPTHLRQAPVHWHDLLSTGRQRRVWRSWLR